MPPSASIHILPFNHQIQAIERFQNSFDHDALHAQSVEVYKHITPSLSLMASMIDDVPCLTQLIGQSDLPVKPLGEAITELQALTAHLFGIAVPDAMASVQTAPAAMPPPDSTLSHE